jgi:3',5'-cyclic AMP phosphodiesterase CpdA
MVWQVFLLTCLLLASCGLRPQAIYLKKGTIIENNLPNRPPGQVLFLVGDAGKTPPSQKKPIVLSDVEKELRQTPNAHLLFLGDNIYPAGLPDSATKPTAYVKGLRSLHDQIETAKACSGKTLFIPGNHDWAIDQPEGQACNNRQAEKIRFLSKGKLLYLPERSCPGPAVVAIDTHLVLIVFDTQWWLHPHAKPLTECGLTHENQWFDRLGDTLKKYAGKKMIVVGHHPLFSSGPHNGGYSIKQHLFPLTEFKKKAYVPLPFLGSVYVLMRSICGHRQDMAHPRYQALRKNMLSLFADYPNLIYVCGHEHSLGYYPFELQHYVLSGAGSKSSQVIRGKGAAFAQRTLGFAKLIAFPATENQAPQMWIEYYACTESTMRLSFRYRLY